MPICYEGGDHITAVAADPVGCSTASILRGRKFFLGVGVDSANKNIETVVEAFSAGQARRHRAGADRRATTPCVFGHLSIVESATTCASSAIVSDPELRALYEHALALVFPSLLRGLRPAAARSDDLRLPGRHQRAAGLVEVCGDAALTLRKPTTRPRSCRHMRALAFRCRPCAPGWRRPAASARAASPGHATARSLLDYCLGARR